MKQWKVIPVQNTAELQQALNECESGGWIVAQVVSFPVHAALVVYKEE